MEIQKKGGIFNTKFILQLTLITGLIAANLYIIINFIPPYSSSTSKTTIQEEMVDHPTAPTFKYGFEEGPYSFFTDRVKENQFLSNLLSTEGINYPTIYSLVQKSKGVFDIRNLRVGFPYTFIYEDPCESPIAMVYEPNRYEYTFFDLKNPSVKNIKREVKTKIESLSGKVNGSLWLSMDKSGSSWELIDLMEGALGWSIDFYHIQNGDQYKLVYERKYVEGQKAGIGKLLGAYYKNHDNEYYAIHYESEKYDGFYDLKGRATKRAFLKSPVKYSRISSGFTRKRFHPVLKRYKSHLGTDYAAPTGTPIHAVANGVVTKASYTRGNGRYVKLRHNKIYETQYLHMSKFAKGMRPGKTVKQGDVIGYVGQTGLATGPHVCFRFWRNGRQIDHRRLKFPPSKSMPLSEMDDFLCESELVKSYLNQMHIEEAPSAPMAKNNP